MKNYDDEDNWRIVILRACIYFCYKNANYNNYNS